MRYSPVEVLRRKDFGEYTAADFVDAQRLMANFRARAAMRRSRRRRPAKGRRHRHPDIRGTVRRALRTGGEPIRRAWYAPTRQPRRVVLLCDISGSMDSYSRALLRFMHAAVAGRRRVEAFTMGTRLTRLTRELLSHNPDRALRCAGAAVPDWSGGTRIGDTLRDYNNGWGMRGMSRGAVVVILSDGWERGDPTVMADQMARLSRVAYKVVWVNPLKASPGYAPLARGMAAALPYVDEFIEGHNLNALDDLLDVISR
ncbi:vWA domain-containing protein [Mycobacterium asiaticum]|nr:VWA domain-containing protein [Mycobacterium asiaticum]